MMACLLWDKMADMNNATDNGTVQREQGTQGGMEGLRVMSQQELGAVQVTAVNAILDYSVHQHKTPFPLPSEHRLLVSFC